MLVDSNKYLLCVQDPVTAAPARTIPIGWCFVLIGPSFVMRPGKIRKILPGFIFFSSGFLELGCIKTVEKPAGNAAVLVAATRY